MLKKEDLLGLTLAEKIVELPTGEVKIREFTTADREKFEVLAMNTQKGSAQNMKAKLIAISVMNDAGTRMFGDDEVAKIAQMPSSTTELLFNEILTLNGMGAGILEDIEGN